MPQNDFGNVMPQNGFGNLMPQNGFEENYIPILQTLTRE
jgi:hypothetical protein